MLERDRKYHTHQQRGETVWAQEPVCINRSNLVRGRIPGFYRSKYDPKLSFMAKQSNTESDSR